MSAIADVQTYLEELGIIDGSTDWPSVRRRYHDESDRLVVLTEDGGSPPEVGRSEGIGSGAIGFAQIQIAVRGRPWNGDESAAKAAEIFDRLHGLTGADLGSGEYLKVHALTSGPVFIGFDEKGRPTHTASYRLGTSIAAPTVA